MGVAKSGYTGGMRKLRLFGALLVLLTTIIVIVHYIHTNPEILRQLRQTRLIYVFVILALYSVVLLSLTIVNTISVRLSSKKIAFKNSFGLTGTSSIANFFGPLQSGVGIRAVYFKTKLGIPIKRYALVSLYYYGLYAFLSGVFLLFGSARWRLPLLGLLIVGTVLTLIYIKRRSARVDGLALEPELLAKLAATVLLQLTSITLIYAAELLALGQRASVGQIISYSGAANFSLFLAITPGAIGVREAFLVFSENLHHIGRDVIVSANILDRGIYVVFLLLVLAWLVLTHSRLKLRAYSSQKQS